MKKLIRQDETVELEGTPEELAQYEQALKPVEIRFVPYQYPQIQPEPYTPWYPPTITWLPEIR